LRVACGKGAKERVVPLSPRIGPQSAGRQADEPATPAEPPLCPACGCGRQMLIDSQPRPAWCDVSGCLVSFPAIAAHHRAAARFLMNLTRRLRCCARRPAKDRCAPPPHTARFQRHNRQWSTLLEPQPLRSSRLVPAYPRR
jgi:hypothetical protein